jgi:hypothetical protein
LEVSDALRAEDVVREEAVDEFEKHVLADVLPLAMPERFAALSPYEMRYEQA